MADPAARDAAPARRLRREHGGGLAALRRQRLHPPERAPTELGTKTELKNMNSFRFLEQGINAEIERQIALLEAGETVVQETLHFDPRTGRAAPAALQGGGARLPLLPRARPRAAGADRGDARAAARAALPELPAERAARYERDWGLPADTARLSRAPARAGRLLRGGRHRGGRRRRGAAGGQLGEGRARRAARRRGRPRRLQRHAAGAGQAGRPGAGGHRHARRRAPGARPAGPSRRRPRGDRRARGPRRDGRRRRARRDRRAR